MSISRMIALTLLVGVPGCGAPEPANAVAENTAASEGAVLAEHETLAAPTALAPSLKPSATPLPIDRPWLVGSWLAKDGHRAGADALILNADGTYAVGYDDSGRWRLSGNRLTFMSGAEEVEHLSTQIVRRVSDNELALDGSHMRRCPPDGG